MTKRVLTFSVIVAGMFALAPLAGSAAAASPSAGSHGDAKPGEMLNDAEGGRLATVDQVDADGAIEIIVDGHVVTVPAETLSRVNSHLMTSLKKPDVISLQ